MNAPIWRGFAIGLVMLAACSQATLANDGQPSRQTLAEMGLGGLVVVSDEEAMTVRGHGYQGGGSSVRVFGNSLATVNTPFGSAHSENGYFANGKYYAAGGNYSEAGLKISTSKGKGGKGNHGGYGGSNRHPSPGGGYGGHGGGYSSSLTIKVFAGGHSWGKAF